MIHHHESSDHRLMLVYKHHLHDHHHLHLLNPPNGLLVCFGMFVGFYVFLYLFNCLKNIIVCL